MDSRLPAPPFLYPILDMPLLGGRFVEPVVRTLARAGVRLLQIRAKETPDPRYLDLAREAVAAARAERVLLVVNDRPDIARIVQADGVHVGQNDLSPTDVRALLPGVIIGLSTHTLDQIAAADTEPVDYVAIGPIFSTRTKANPDAVVGTDLLRRARLLTKRPLVAIGGIARANAREVLDAGADGLAVISDLLAAPDLDAAVREFQLVLARR